MCTSFNTKTLMTDTRKTLSLAFQYTLIDSRVGQSLVTMTKHWIKLISKMKIYFEPVPDVNPPRQRW